MVNWLFLAIEVHPTKIFVVWFDGCGLQLVITMSVSQLSLEQMISRFRLVMASETGPLVDKS